MVALALLALAPPAAAQVSFSSPTAYATGNLPQEAGLGDFNGDGDRDLATANGGSDNVSVLLGGPGGSFGAATNFPVGMGPGAVGVGLFNADSDPDLVTPNLTSDDVSVLLGGPGGSFGTAANSFAGDNARKLAVADFNLDGNPDLAVTILNAVNVLLGDGGGNFGAPTSFPAGNPRAIAVGFFNGDSDPDLALTEAEPPLGPPSNQVLVLLGGTGGSFGPATSIPFPAGSKPTDVAVADLNGDAKQDLAVANDGSSNVSILLGDGAGSFAAPTNVTAGTNPNGVAVADVNGDGIPDLVVANRISDDVSILLGQPGGGFAAAAQFPAGDWPERPVTGDFDADGKPDLAVPNVASDTVSVLLNQTPFPAPPPPPPVCCAPPPPVPGPVRLADLPDPVQGRVTNVAPVGRGPVFVGIPARLAGAGRARTSQKGVRFVPLREARQIPVGSFLDTRKGKVRLQSARDRRGTRQQGDFGSGLFQVLQSRKSSARGLTDLVLKGSSFSRCGSTGRGKRSARTTALSRSTRRRLRANARGRFRTRGRHSAATVRGTTWTTADRCDGTLTKVTRGRVAVRDFRRKKTVLVRAGKSYLAKARR